MILGFNIGKSFDIQFFGHILFKFLKGNLIDFEIEKHT